MEKFLEARCMAENAQQGNGTPSSRTHPEHTRISATKEQATTGYNRQQENHGRKCDTQRAPQAGARACAHGRASAEPDYGKDVWMRKVEKRSYREKEKQNKLHAQRLPHPRAGGRDRTQNERTHTGRPACDLRIRHARRDSPRREARQTA